MFSGVELVLGLVGALFALGFRAQGGRSELSCEAAVTAINSAAAARATNCRVRKSRVHIR